MCGLSKNRAFAKWKVKDTAEELVALKLGTLKRQPTKSRANSPSQQANKNCLCLAVPHATREERILGQQSRGVLSLWRWV
eukprot:4982350-Amphidinium_carterae.1